MDISLPLDKMTNLNKIALMAQLWDDLCRDPESVPSPDWHKNVLAEREERIKKGTVEFTRFEVAKDRIRNQTK
ncbi:addiction module protein [Thermodesulfobacteriota bacterium]